MSIANDQEASDLYIGYNNFKSNVGSIVSALNVVLEQAPLLMALPGFNETASAEEIDWVNTIISMTTNILNTLPAAPDEK